MAKKTAERRSEGSRALIQIEVDLGSYGKYYLNKLENLSIGGAFVRSRSLHPVGTEVSLKFRLPNDENPVEAEGEVVWTYKQPDTQAIPNSSGMGIRFTKIGDKDRKRIADYVSTAQPLV